MTPTELHEAAEKLYALAPEARAKMLAWNHDGYWLDAERDSEDGMNLTIDHAAAIITTAAMEWAENQPFWQVRTNRATNGGWTCVIRHIGDGHFIDGDVKPHRPLAILAAITAAAAAKEDQ